MSFKEMPLETIASRKFFLASMIKENCFSLFGLVTTSSSRLLG